tara:strand:+ start:827 stop:1027 length:201 start_codon:yes stop_codon:yes gene_type:complete
MKKRSSIVFGELSETEKTTLKVITKSPEKWILIDTETMQFYQGCKDVNEVKQMWKKIDSLKINHSK